MRISQPHIGLFMFSAVIVSLIMTVPLSFADYVDYEATSDGSVMVVARWGGITDGRLNISVEFTDAQSKSIDNVNYSIVATQNNNVILVEQVRSGNGQANHATSLYYPGVPVKMDIKLDGMGLAEPYTGPKDTISLEIFSPPTDFPLTVITDRSAYVSGDAIIISGISKDSSDVSVQILDSNYVIVYVSQASVSNEKYLLKLTAGGKTWQETGNYVVNITQGEKIAQTKIWFEAENTKDSTMPLLLTPSDMIIKTHETKSKVEYSVKGIDDVDGILNPTCNPASGSYFGIGDTLVTCMVSDSAGNKVQEKFLVTVNDESENIPVWIKDVAGFWCNEEIDDSGFIEGIQYLIENNVLIISGSTDKGNSGDDIPSWIKNNACWWSEEAISDDEFSTGIQYLISNGIIRVS